MPPLWRAVYHLVLEQDSLGSSPTMRLQALGGSMCVSSGVCVRLGWRRGSPVIPVESGWGASYVVMNDSVAMLSVGVGVELLGLRTGSGATW